MSNSNIPDDPSWRNEPATWSKPSTWIIGTIVALVILFGAAFMFGGQTGRDTADNPTTTNPPAGAQISVPPAEPLAASPPASPGSGTGGGQR